MAAADEALDKMVRSLEAKTGKPIEAWLEIARKSSGSKHGEIVRHLKNNGLTHGYANLVAHTMLQSASVHADEGDLIEAQYAGAKGALRPIYERLVAEVQKFGADLEVAPKKAYVSLRRKKQFAILQPSTATRLDVGINLKGVAPEGRLEASGSLGSMVSHRVRVGSVKDVDKELIGWLKKAYEAA